MKRYKKASNYAPVLPTYETEILFDLLKKVVVYGRQSTKNQVHKAVFSREMQTDVLIAKAISLGWPEDAIILYIENLRKDGTIKAASGRLRIDEREGLSAVVERIEKGEISAAMVSRVDRLFRDETEIEPNKFILACKSHRVYIITLERVYNFANPDDCEIFREKCRQAAAELRTFKERLGGPKDLAAQAGYYDGRALTIGFFIDHRQTIIIHGNEVDNPQWKKLNNYPPHQAVIEEIYDLLVANGWDIPKTYRQIRQRPVLFPDFESWVGEASAKKVFLLKVPGGYQMSYKAFLHMLCNVTLIGYWPYRGTIRKHNHPAVIDEQRFWIGFYLVSDVTPEGELIERESRKRYAKERTQQQNPRPIALLEKVIESPDPKKAVYVHPVYNDWYYQSVWRGALEGPYPEKFSMLVTQVDAIVMAKMRERIAAPTDLDELRELLAAIVQNYQKARQNTIDRLDEIESQMQAALTSLLDKKTKPATRSALNEIYAQLAAERDSLEASLTPSDDSEEAQIIAHHEKLQGFMSIDEMSDEHMQILVKAMIKRITFEGISCHFIRLHITWRSPQWCDEEAIVWRLNGRAPLWTQEEIALVIDCYPTVAQLDLMRQLPRRTWFSIKMKASKEGVQRLVRTQSQIPDINLSWEDVQVIEQYNLSPSLIVSSDIHVTWCRSAPTRARPSWIA